MSLPTTTGKHIKFDDLTTGKLYYDTKNKLFFVCFFRIKSQGEHRKIQQTVKGKLYGWKFLNLSTMQEEDWWNDWYVNTFVVEC